MTAGNRLSVMPPVQGVPVVPKAAFAHSEIIHRRKGPIVREPNDYGIAGATVYTGGPPVAVVVTVLVVDISKASVTDGCVGRDRASPIALATSRRQNAKLRLPSLKLGLLQYKVLYFGQGRGVFPQRSNEVFDSVGEALHHDLHARITQVADAASKAEAHCTAVHERAKSDSLDDASYMNSDPTYTGQQIVLKS